MKIPASPGFYIVYSNGSLAHYARFETRELAEKMVDKLVFMGVGRNEIHIKEVIEHRSEIVTNS